MRDRARFGIGKAVKLMQNGERVSRGAWNGNRLDPVKFKVRLWCYLFVPSPEKPAERPFVMMRTVEGHHVPWVCSQTDLLATDWFSMDDTG